MDEVESAPFTHMLAEIDPGSVRNVYLSRVLSVPEYTALYPD
jgi:hypothetical protein